MKLLTKFNLLLLALFGAAGLIISQVVSSFLMSNAKREVLQEAQLMMASANSVRDYTSSDLRPLLEENPVHKKHFLAETVPAIGALATFSKLRANYPDYSYREATLNPTNPEHRATDWESDIIRHLRTHPDLKQVDGERDTPIGPALYLATPIPVTPACLECHSVPSAAPPSMIAVYGPNNGFGWKVNSIVGAQIVTVPMTVPLQKANEAYHRVVSYLIVILLMTLGVLDVAVYFIVIRPLKQVSEAADRVSKGDMHSPPLAVNGNDEIAAVTKSFNRMQLSLIKAFKMLG